MRDLQECKAEIILRSEKRIRRRRVGRAIVDCCIPLVLCVTVLAVVMAWPENRSGYDGMDGGNILWRPGADGDVVAGDSQGVVAGERDTGVWVSGAGTSGKITDPDQVAQIEARLELLFAMDGNGGNDSGSTDGVIGDLETDPPEDPPCEEPQRYTIRVNSEGGTQKVYTLVGNKLHNRQTEQTVALADSQLAGLMALLGLA